VISLDYARTMARYNAWQNRSLYREADRLTETQRSEDRGAFFGSVQATLGHLLWGDRMWMARFGSGEKPVFSAKGEGLDWGWLTEARRDTDARISAWAAGLTDADLAGDLTWHSAILKADRTQPRWILVTHFFNHQTHHRGQVHALLTGFGMTPDATDLGFMPDDA
jgi:uncharacterized damage-inducible protein DinB